MRNLTRKSRFYPAERSWTKTPAWAFEVPLTFIEASPPSTRITLLCQNPTDRDSFLVLEVPVAFLKERQADFFVREDHMSISLFLSAVASDRFTDLRGSGKVPFRPFLVRK